MSGGARLFYLACPGQGLYILISLFNSTTDGILANLVGGDVARRDLEAAAAKRWLPAPPTLSHVRDDDSNDSGDSDQMGRETPV